MTKHQPDHVWYTRCPVPTPLGIAVQFGWVEEVFGRHGIPVKSIADSPDPEIRASHFDHRLDWSFRQGGNVPPIWTRANGRRTRLVGITWNDEFQAIVTLASSGLKSLRDLVGRRFGLPRHEGAIVDFNRATALKGLVSALSLEDLSIGDITLVDVPAEKATILKGSDDLALFGLKRRLPYSAEFAALLRGDVDAVFVKGTAGVAIGNLFAARTLSEFGFHPDPKIRINAGSPRIFTVDETFADARPDLVAELIGAVRRVGVWAKDHPDDVRRYIARDAGASEEQVLVANGPGLHHNLGIGLQPELVEAIAHYKDFLRDWNFLPGDFDVADWVDHRPDALTETAKAA